MILMKTLVTVGVVLTATAIADRFPSLGGLIGVMPLTGALVLIWTYLDHAGEPKVAEDLAKGALWGIAPSILFFAVALLLLKWRLSLPVVILGSFGSWLLGAFVHSWLLG
jgi:uncharacterized membrane protein (GlpM family)